MPEPAYILLGDQPRSGDVDPLGFATVTDDLARLILASRGSTPFTLGIEASWGMGKSTLMQLLKERLALEPAVTPVWFNAWTANRSGMLEGLIKTVLEEIDGSVLRRVLRSRNLLRGIRAAFVVLSSTLGLGNLADEFWKRVAADPRARNELRGFMGDAVQEWRRRQVSRSGGVVDEALLCVFIDDVDRCGPASALEVFEAMKLYLDVPGFVFVVGYDREIVAGLVHKDKGYGDRKFAVDYLEKIIQTTYRIPRSGSAQSEALVKECLDASRTTDLFGDAERSLVIERNERNPRRIKRFINSFVLTYGLEPEWKAFAPQSLIRTQLVYMYFRDFAELLDRPSERDPAQEFLDYVAARDGLRLRARDPAAWQRLVTALAHWRLPLTESAEAADFDLLLRQLDEHVPLPFPGLASQEEFVSLVESLVGAPDWSQLRARLAAGTPPPAAVVSVEEGDGDPLDGIELDGLRVLWIDDRLEDHRALVDRIRAAGATLTVVSSAEEARERFRDDAYEVLISDVRRGDQPDAGFEGLHVLQSEGIQLRGAIFFTARVTPARKRSAAALGASIVSNPAQLLRSLQDLGIPRVRQHGPVLGTVLVAHHAGDVALARRLQGDLRRRIVGDVQLVHDAQQALTSMTEGALVQVMGPAWHAAVSSGERRDDMVALPDTPDSLVSIVFAAMSGDGEPTAVPTASGSQTVVEIRDDHWIQDVTKLIDVLNQMHLSAVPVIA